VLRIVPGVDVKPLCCRLHAEHKNISQMESRSLVFSLRFSRLSSLGGRRRLGCMLYRIVSLHHHPPPPYVVFATLYRLDLVMMMSCMLLLLVCRIATTSHAFSVGSSLFSSSTAKRTVPRLSSSCFAPRRTSSTSTTTTTTTTTTTLFGKKGWKQKSSSPSSFLNSGVVSSKKVPVVCTPRTLHVEIEEAYSSNSVPDDAPWKMKDLVDILNRGGVGVLPTETGYGLVTRLIDNNGNGKSATGGGNHGKNCAGLERLLRIKKMHATCTTMPLSLLCSNVATIDEYCALYTLPKQVFKILKKNLPGPYTFLLQAVKTTTTTTTTPTTATVVVSSLNDNVTICKANPGWKRDTIGIRMPKDAVLRYFQDELYDGAPLIFSALPLEDDDDDDNDSNEADIDRVNEMYKLVRPQPQHWYWDVVDFVVDAGTRPMGDGSTVIDLMTVSSGGGGGGGGAPQLVRPGLGALELTV
jgi:tRNA A37 threonylcarbamoyladenosine synthetase subunit TsaC/SUA5/YrdC